MYKTLLIFLLSVLLVACSGASRNAASLAVPEDIVIPDYRIDGGDQIHVNVWKNADLTMNVSVRPDGRISVPLIGDVMAAGETAESLALNIETALSEYLRSPQVTVVVTNAASAEFQQRVRVTGAVQAPQSLPYRAGMTVMDVVLQAGGLTPFASSNKATLHRKTSEGMQSYKVRLNDILEKGILTTNYELAPSDIITIPSKAF